MENKDYLRISRGGLYAPLPIPAYNVLGRAGEYQAQKVLVSLVSHMGKGSNCVYPSYTTIAKNCGMGRTAISKGLSILCEYGFIKIARFRDGKKSRSKYFIQNCCWNSSLMKDVPLEHKRFKYVCLACGELTDRSGVALSDLGPIHYGCGGYCAKATTKVLRLRKITYSDRAN
jgi:hypothetical protein